MFFNPLLLWLLPLAAVPILLHLLTRFRIQTIDLSTFRFLMDSYVKQRRRMRLTDLLVLLLRVLAVLLIILMLSRPLLGKHSWLFAGKGGREVVLAIDTGASMGYRSGGASSLDRAKRAATDLLHKLQPDDRVTLMKIGHETEVIFQGVAAERDRIEARLKAMKPAAARSRPHHAINLLTAKQTVEPRAVYLFSDMQRRAFAPLLGHDAVEQLPAQTRLTLMDVGPEEPIENLAVSSVSGQGAGRSLRPIAGLPVVLTAEVGNLSAERPLTAPVALVIEGQRVGRQLVALEPGERGRASFVYTPEKPGVVRGWFELPEDRFDVDDRYHLTLNVADRLRVLLVAGPRAAKQVDRQELYVRAAMRAPNLAAADDVSQANNAQRNTRKLAASIALDETTEDALRDGSFSGYDVVVLAGGSITPFRADLLQRHVQGGGGLVVFPSADLRQVQNIARVLPAMKFAAPVGDTSDPDRFLPVTALDITHPVMEAFDESGQDAPGDAFDGPADVQAFATTRIFRHYPVVMVNSAPNVPPGASSDGNPATDSASNSAYRPRVLARLAGGAPLAIAGQQGDGRYVLFSVPASPTWSNLSLKPHFVPMLLRSVAFARRPQAIDLPASVAAHQSLAVSLRSPWDKSRVEVTDPSKKTQPLPLASEQGVGRASFSSTAEPGAYSLRIRRSTSDDSGPGGGVETERGFSVNLDPQHADFTTLSEAELRQAFAPHEFDYLRGKAADPTAVGEHTRKRELWGWLLTALALVITAEFLMATSGRSVKVKQREATMLG